MDLVRLSLFVAASLSGQTIDFEARFVEGLRERGMFRLAEIQCRDISDAESLDDEERARIAVELAKTYTAHALHSNGRIQDALWKDARRATEEFLNAYPDQPRRLIIQAQGALTALAQVELAAQEAEVSGDSNALEIVRAQIRTAIGELESIQQDIARPRRRSRDAAALSDDELRALGRHMQYQLARAFRLQALCYPSDSADRVNSLTRAVRQLEPLGRSTVGDDLVWQSRLDEAVCQRLLKNYDLARTKLRQLRPSELPEKLGVTRRAERARLLLAEGNTDEALRLLEAAARDDAPEIDLAVMETMVAHCQTAQQSRDRRQAEQWQDRASKQAEQVRRRHGAYWAHQADLQLKRIGSAGSDQANVRMLARSAESFLRRDLPEDAAQAYIRAAQQAEALRDQEQAFQLRYKAGLVEHQRSRWQPAIDRLRDVALRYPENRGAAKAHLLAAFDASSLLRQSSTDADTLRATQQYRALLEEHLKRWPGSETSDTARWWLGRLHEAAGEWSEATARFQAISAGFPKPTDRFDRLVYCLQRQLATSSSDEYETTIEQARDWFDRQIRNAQGDASVPWLSPAAQQAARLRLLFQPVQYAEAAASLVTAVDAAGRSAESARTARCLQIVAFAGLGKYDDALAALNQAVPISPSSLVESLRGLQILFDSLAPESREELTTVQLALVDSVIPRRSQLEPAEQLVLETSRADALSFAERDRSLSSYENLATVHPQDARIQRRYAEILLGGMDRTSYQAALEQWRRVLRGSRPQSVDWFRAKHGVALAHYKLGNRDQAIQLIRLTQQLHPEMGGVALQHQFRRLLKLCEQ